MINPEISHTNCETTEPLSGWRRDIEVFCESRAKSDWKPRGVGDRLNAFLPPQQKSETSRKPGPSAQKIRRSNFEPIPPICSSKVPPFLEDMLGKSGNHFQSFQPTDGKWERQWKAGFMSGFSLSNPLSPFTLKGTDPSNSHYIGNVIFHF